MRPPHGDEPAKSRPALSAEPLRRLSQPQRRRGLGRHQRRAALALRLSHGRASARAGDSFRRARGRPGGALRLRRPAYGVSHQKRRQGVAKTHPRSATEECLHSGPAPRHADRYLRQILQSISEPPAGNFTTRSTTATTWQLLQAHLPREFIRWKRWWCKRKETAGSVEPLSQVPRLSGSLQKNRRTKPRGLRYPLLPAHLPRNYSGWA